MLRLLVALVTAHAPVALSAAACGVPASRPQRPRLAAPPAAFYVSPSGDDSWSGTLPAPNPARTDGPFLTPAAAAAAVEAVPRPLAQDLLVQLRAGTYYLNETLLLGPGAGGDGPAARVVWSSFPADGPGSAVLSGGARVFGWAPSATPGVVTAALPASAPARSRGLFVGGARRWPARVPPAAGPARSDFASDASTLHYASSLDGCGFDASSSCFPAECANATHAVNELGFVYNASDARGPSPGWGDIAGIDALVFGSWTAAWAPVRAIVASNSTLLTAAPLATARPGKFGGAACPSGARYILFNVAEALAPGSFYVNDNTQTVTYALLPGESAATLDAVVPVLGTVVNVQGDDCGGPVSDLVLASLNVSHASDGGARAVPYHAPFGAVQLSSARDVALDGVDVSSSDGAGVLLGDFLVRATLSRVRVRGVGGDGVGVGGAGTGGGGGAAPPVNTTIADCVVDGTGLIFLNQPAGIAVQGDASGVAVVEHNLVRDTPYAGVMVGWQPGAPVPPAPAPWQFVVRGNDISGVGNAVLSDFAGVYVSVAGHEAGTCEPAGACFLPTLIAGNRVQGVRAYSYGGAGVYADENVAGVAAVGNAVGDVSGAGAYLHCGRNLTLRNNVFWRTYAHGGAGASASFRGPPGALDGCNTAGVDPAYALFSADVRVNVFLLDGSPNATLFDDKKIGWLRNATFDDNVYWAAAPLLNVSGLRWPDANGATSYTFPQWQAAGQDARGAVADPLLADPAAGDYALRPGSPALARGFVQLDQSWGPRPV